jgi:hypothetical protein
LDYLYTALYHQTIDGTPTLNPLFFLYPEDSNALPIQAQFFFGSSILVSPVTTENATEVTIYQPNDQFYDFWTWESIRGLGDLVTLPDVNHTQIPVYIKGGSIIPIRVDGAATTTALRALDLNLIVAPGLWGNASGSLYLDDGVSIEQAATSLIDFEYTGTSLNVSGTFDYDAGVKIANIILLDAEAITIPVNKPLTRPFSITLYPNGAPPITGFSGPVALPGAINAPGNSYIRTFPLFLHHSQKLTFYLQGTNPSQHSTLPNAPASAKLPLHTKVVTQPPTAPIHLVTSSSLISRPKTELVRACFVICIRNLGMRVMRQISGKIGLGIYILFLMCMRIPSRRRIRGRLGVDGEEVRECGWGCVYLRYNFHS